MGRGSAAGSSDRAATSRERSWRKGRRRTTARRRRAQRAGGGPREDDTDPRADGAAAGAGSRRPEPHDRSSEARCDVATRCNSRPDASSLSSSSNCSVGAPESLSRLPLSGDASPAEIEIAADRASAKASRSPATTVARTARAIRRLRRLELMSDELCDRNRLTVLSLRHRGGGGQSQASHVGFGHPNRLADSPHRGCDCDLDGGAGSLPWTQRASVSVSWRPAVDDLRAGWRGRAMVARRRPSRRPALWAAWAAEPAAEIRIGLRGMVVVVAVGILVAPHPVEICCDGAMPCRPEQFDVCAKRFAISAKWFRQSCETVCETVPALANRQPLFRPQEIAASPSIYWYLRLVRSRGKARA